MRSCLKKKAKSEKNSDFLSQIFLPRGIEDPALISMLKSTIHVALQANVVKVALIFIFLHFHASISATIVAVNMIVILGVLALIKMGHQQIGRALFFLADCTMIGLGSINLGMDSFCWMYIVNLTTVGFFLTLPTEIFLRKFNFIYGGFTLVTVLLLGIFKVFPAEFGPEYHQGVIYFGMFSVVYGALNLLVLVIRYKRDVVRYKHQLEQQSITMLQQAKMSSLGEMAGGLAHEINNPLAMILGHSTQLLRETGSPQPKLEAIAHKAEKIYSTVTRISKIVSALRTFSHNADGDPFEIASSSKIVTNVTDFCHEKLSASQIELRITGQKNLQLECRPTQIAQVLVSLTYNSIEAVQRLPEKWIEIHLEGSGERMTITVIDSGKGIPPEVAEKIMQPFFTTKEIGKGTGLGLSVSKGIIEAHHGTLTLDGSYANTRFIIDLPARQATPQLSLPKAA